MEFKMVSALAFLVLAFQSTSASDSTYATAVKKLIDAGTCASITTTSTICGDSSLSSSYYETFTYNNYRVVIISGVPNHAAEYSQASNNNNTRCVRWQYMAAPLTPTKLSSYVTTGAGTIAMFTSGAVLYNPVSSVLTGTMAGKFERSSLDPCFGHSSPDSQYHYHAISSCITGATTPSAHTLLGYMLDGYPVYGYSQNTAGSTLKSCWTASSASPSYISEFTYDTASYNNGTCDLDMANGYTFSDGTYGYVMVASNYYVPYYRAGSSFVSACGFTP
jgi:hypothetical protein